jgi:hypothetical protein
MAEAFIVKDRIEAIESKFDLLLSEEQIRAFTQSVVRDAMISPIAATKQDINDLIGDASDHIAKEYDRVIVNIDDKFLDARQELADHVTSSIRDIERRFERIEFMMKISFCINAIGMIGSIAYLLLK